MKKLKFIQIQRHLKKIFLRIPGASLTLLANGAIVAKIGGAGGKRIAIIAGLHGNELGGALGAPLALTHFLKKSWRRILHHPKKLRLLIAPLVNDFGWDNNTRLWQGKDLNRSFKRGAPVFISELMKELKDFSPDVFLDLHEDITKPYPYVFVDKRNPRFGKQLARLLGVKTVAWWSPKQWKGASEVFMRKNGCKHYATIEAPQVWHIKRRKDYYHRVVDTVIARANDLLEYGR